MALNPHNRLLRRVRDAALSRWLLRRLVKANVEPEELTVTAENGGFLLRLADGTQLKSTSTPDESFRGRLNGVITLPPGGEIAVYDYILRYKYPHFDPSKRPSTGPLERSAVELAMHLQHRNTFWSLDDAQRVALSQRFALAPGDQVLEAGPYLGFGTVRMARLVGPTGKVIAAEAGVDTVETTRENLKLNGITNTFVHYCAIGNQDGEMKLSAQVDQRVSIVEGVVDESHERTVPTRSIESLCREHELTPTFMILTINGAELMAIQGSRDFIRDCPGLRLIVPGWYRDERGPIGQRVADELKSIGFTTVITRDWLVCAYN